MASSTESGFGTTAAASGPDAAPNAAVLAQDALVVAHLPLVRALAARLYRMRWSDAVAFDEYCQMGSVGLVDASRRFDERRGIAFGAFASWRITGAILDGLELATEQHQQIAARKRLIGERTVSIAQAEGPTARVDADNTDDALDATLARLAQVAVGLAVGFMLEGTGMYNEGEAAGGLDGDGQASLRQAGLRLREAMRALAEEQQLVLHEHYFEHRSFGEIADGLRLTRGRVSQIHRSGIEQLRARLAPSELDAFSI